MGFCLLPPSMSFFGWAVDEVIAATSSAADESDAAPFQAKKSAAAPAAPSDAVSLSRRRWNRGRRKPCFVLGVSSSSFFGFETRFSPEGGKGDE